MIESVVDKPGPAGQEVGLSRRWFVGVFAPGNGQPPAACLEQCLNEDPALASTHGCALLKHLDERAQAGTGPADSGAPPFEPPPVCDRGYAVSLFESDRMDSPDVLILRPPADHSDPERITSLAIEHLRSAAVQNWRLNQENYGLADEVLRIYEQINLIFDISAQIAIRNEAEEIRRMLLTKLRDLLKADGVFLIAEDERTAIHVDGKGHVVRGLVLETGSASQPGSGAWPSARTELFGATGIRLPREFQQARDRLRQSRRVFVLAEDPGDERAGRGTSMWGALKDQEAGFSVIGIIRRHTPFVSGDMLLLDSTLTYGGHILNNLRLVEQLKRTSFEAVRTLVNAIDAKDSYTCGHSERVGLLAKATGQLMGLPPGQLKELEWAALLHDVGKIGIPEQVLNKPGRLTDEEYAVVKNHPLRGFEILRPAALLEPVLRGVLHHHENPDGTGYPDGLKADEIPLMARIIHVVDVFDALTSTRPYRKSYDVDHALNILGADAGTKLDARVVEAFLTVWARLPATHPQEYERWFGPGREEGS